MAPISFGRSEVRFSGEFGSGSRGSPWSLEVKLSGELGSRARASFGVFEVGFRSSSGARRPCPSGFGRSLLSDDGPTGSERGGRRRWDALRSTPTSTPLAAEDVGAPVRVVDSDEGSSGSRGWIDELHGPSSPEATRRSPQGLFGVRAEGRRARREAATTGLRGISVGSSDPAEVVRTRTRGLFGDTRPRYSPSRGPSGLRGAVPWTDVCFHAGP
jgi:hypothetical protein